MSRIDVFLQIERWPSSKDIRMSVDLDPIQREALQPLDFAVNGPGFMCTPAKVVHQIMHTREGLAKDITSAIMKVLAQRDTHDGYPKDSP